MDEVLRCIQLGAVTIADLEAETGFIRAELSKVISCLERKGKIRTTPYSDGGRGRPPMLIKIIT